MEPEKQKAEPVGETKITPAEGSLAFLEKETAVTMNHYLLTYKHDDLLDELYNLLPSTLDAKSLVSSTEVRKRVSEGVGVVNRGIRVVSTMLTSSKAKKIKEKIKGSKLYHIEKDQLAYSCAIRPTTVEAAVQEFPYPWGIKKIDADIAWQETKGKGTKVAILDTGVEADHPNLKTNVKKGASFLENVPSTNTNDDSGMALIVLASSLRILRTVVKASMGWPQRHPSFLSRC